MRSESERVLSFGRNVEENDTGPWQTSISVPEKFTVMFSVVSLVYVYTEFDGLTLWLFHCQHKFVCYEACSTTPNYMDCELAFAYNVNYIKVQLIRPDVSTRRKPINETLFQVFFSFFPESKAPEKLPSGQWNCSVAHYASFRHHMACNLKTECEDGQDETEHCPYSSDQCQGMVALCGRCYKFVWEDQLSHKDVLGGNKKASEYCGLHRGTLGFPLCVYDPYNVIVNMSRRHWHKLDEFVAGIYVHSRPMPNMYKHSLHGADRTVFHHSLGLDQFNSLNYNDGQKTCIRLSLIPMHTVFAERCTDVIEDDMAKYGLICEMRPNQTDTSPRSDRLRIVNTQAWLTKRQPSLTLCHNGQVTHTFLLCGSHRHELCGPQLIPPCQYSYETSSIPGAEPINPSVPLIPSFTCNDEFSTRLSYTLVCDLIPDCVNDESFCEHPFCQNTLFTCTSGQCLAHDNVCDHIAHCTDESDERECHTYKNIKIVKSRFPPPFLIGFDGISQFSTIQMKSNESCPDSHYLCPGPFRDCLPVYTRCNGMYDCRQHEDEQGCTDITCPGLFRCRSSLTCVHNDNLCDGWPHCPMHDDELGCDMTCPQGCLCQGHSFLCPQPFQAALFPQIRSLDGTGSGLTPSDLISNVYLVHLVLARCSLTRLSELKWSNVRLLDLSDNKVQHFNVSSLISLKYLFSFSLSGNPVLSLTYDPSSVMHKNTLTMIDMSYTELTFLDPTVFSPLSRLQKLNLTFITSLHALSKNGFQHIQQLHELYLEGSPVKRFPPDIFKGLFQLRFISAENYKLCCEEILPDNFDTSSCHAPSDEVSSCEDLLRSWMYRGFLWLITCLTVSGNVFCFCARIFAKGKTSSSGFTVFVTNLTLADFLMGVYMAVIGIADDSFRSRYLHQDDTWKHSVACKVAGFLSLLSCEVSALIICLITADRFIVLCFPFSALRFERTSAAMVCVLIWLTGCVFALVPLLLTTSHWEFYSQTGICIPLPVTRKEFKGKFYSFSILIVFNFVLFVFISVGQGFIYWTIQCNALKTSSTKVSQDMVIARRLMTIALTDFLCWFPIGLCGMLVLAGVPIPGEINVGLAIFVLPLNSAINPFMYTFNTLAEKWRKSKETKTLKWLESHADCLQN